MESGYNSPPSGLVGSEPFDITMRDESMMKNAAKFIGFVWVALAMTAYAVTDKQRAAIEERIKPAGQVCLEGDDGCGAAAASSSGPKSAEDIYSTNCLACHATGAGGAPVMGDVADWNTRMGKGIDTVYANAINGVGGMPAKGLCLSCSDDDIKATVDYILENSQ